ncbi:MAG: hypothetical protein FJX77_05500 [Armatimonadetes bacterium]|nr:hypothetical protein [Armatimonadota bacterium]
MKKMRAGFALLLAGVLAVAVAGRSAAQAGAPLVLVGSAGLVGVTLDEQAVSPASISPRTAKKVVTRLNTLFSRLVQDQTGRALGRRARSSRALRTVNNLFTTLLARQIATPTGRVSAQALSGPIGVAVVAAPFTTGGLDFTTAYDLGYNLRGTGYGARLDSRQTVSSGGTTIQVDFTSLPAGAPQDGTVIAALLRATSNANAGLLVVGVFDSNLPAVLEESGIVNATSSNVSVEIPFDLAIGLVDGVVHETPDDPVFPGRYFAKENVVGLSVPPTLVSGIQSLVNSLPADGS